MLPLIDLTQEDIDQIIERTPGGLANIEDIYALSPLQQGLLFHHLLATEGDPYLLTGLMAFTERGLLDPLAGGRAAGGGPPWTFCARGSSGRGCPPPPRWSGGRRR